MGAIRKTFGRCSGSTSPPSPSKTTQIGMCAFAASAQVASTPVPSLTIATACSLIARRTSATAREGDWPLSSRSTRTRYDLEPIWIGVCVWNASSAASAMPWPR